jgi:hypothetical protein
VKRPWPAGLAGRAAAAIAGIAACLVIAGCDSGTTSETVTASMTQAGLTIQMVVTSDPTAISAIESSGNTYANDANFAGVTFTPGDTHKGPRVCGFDVSNSRHSYQVTFYGTVSSEGAEQVCSAASQVQFLTTAP